MNGRRPTAVALLVLSLLLARCSIDREIAHVGDSSLTVDDLNRYFAVSFVPEESGSVEGDVVRSRLLDSLIDERLLLEEAARRGLTVGEEEVDRAVAAESAPEAGVEEEESAPPDRTLVTERLLVDKLFRQVLEQAEPVSETDVEAYVEAYRDRLERTLDRVRVRVIAFDSAAEAEHVRAAVQAGELTFGQASERQESDAAQADAVSLSRRRVSGSLREVLFDLPAGAISPPVEINDRFHLFEIVEPAQNPAGAEALREIARAELSGLRRERERRRLLHSVRSRIEVELFEDRLPFRYVPAR